MLPDIRGLQSNYEQASGALQQHRKHSRQTKVRPIDSDHLAPIDTSGCCTFGIHLGQQPSLLAKILDKDEFSMKQLSIVYVRLVFKQGDLCDATFSRHIISLNDFTGVMEILNLTETNTVEMHLASWCSEQMDVPESIDVIMNVIIVFWNMIVSAVVASWCGQGFTMVVVLPC